MTFATEKVKPGRQPIIVVEIDLDFCQEVYSVAPCTASLGVTGDNKCYNTRISCQDPPNYNPAARTYRFAEQRTGLPADQDLLPVLRKVTLSPTQITPGKGLGIRAKVQCEFVDFPYHDIGLDKYFAERPTQTDPYVPIDTGSFFAKLFTRNPFYQNRPLRVRSGFITDPWDFANFETREYVIDSVSGPDRNGRVTIVAKDILKLADDKRALCPVETSGILLSDLAKGVTASFTLNLVDVGDPATEYPTTGARVAIGDELIDYASRAAGVCSTLIRGVGGTEDVAHDADEQVQTCKVFTRTSVELVVQDLLENFANIAATNIPIADWTAETERWLSRHFLTRTIARPTGVNKLITELTKFCLFFIYWDEIDQEIKFVPLKPPDPIAVPTTVDESSNIIANTLNVKDDPTQRVSRVIVGYKPRNQLETSEPTDYLRFKVIADLDREGVQKFGEKRPVTFLVAWFDEINDGQAVALAGRHLARFGDNPKIINFDLDPKDSDLWTSDLFNITTSQIVNDRGEPTASLFQVLSVRERESKYEYKAQSETFSGRYAVIGPNSLGTYTTETQANRDRYGFVAPASGDFPDDGPPYKIH